MKIPLRFLTTICVTILTTHTLVGGEWINLFNGKSLEGWSVQCVEADKNKVYWKAVNGVIQCNSMGDPKHEYVWLQYDQEFSDFELRLKFRAFRESQGNSGVQFRSRYDASDTAPEGGWLDGPQVDIHPPNPFRNGLIYDETRTEKRWISPSLKNWEIDPSQGPENIVFRFSDEDDGWNEMVIRCEGTRVQTWVNDISVSDYDGAGTLDNDAHKALHVGMKGFITLQLHKNNELKIEFKSLKIKEL